MKSKLLTVTAACLMIAGSAVQAAGPQGVADVLQSHSQRVTASADGGVCRLVGEDWRCRSFAIQQYREPTGQYLETRLWINQYWSQPNGYRYRYLECLVDRQALLVTPNRATVQAEMDADSELCSSYGEIVTYEPYSIEPWSFTGIVSVDAAFLDPRFQSEHNSQVTQRDNQTGESWREHCHGGSAWEMTSGGMTIAGVYFTFVTGGDTTGQFYYEKCGTTNK